MHGPVTWRKTGQVMGMNKRVFNILGLFIAFLSIILVSQVVASSQPIKNQWLSTGIITKVESGIIYLIDKDNILIRIDTTCAKIIRLECACTKNNFNVGDRVRVFGEITGKCCVKAIQIRFLNTAPMPKELSYCDECNRKPDKEVKVIIAKEDIPSETGCGPSDTDNTYNWKNRGLVTNIDYSGNRITLQTSQGGFTVRTGSAVITNGNKRIAIARLNPGDAVKVSGRLIGNYEVDAMNVDITRTRVDAQHAPTQTPVSVIGYIQQIDYASMTFRMTTRSTTIVVAADDNTQIQQQLCPKRFSDLKPGMKVRMSGSGIPGSGFAAQHILIISVAP